MLRSNVTAAAAGAGGISFPIWNNFLTSGWSILIAVMGAIVLGLTIWSKILEIKQKNRDLKQPKR